MRNRLKNSPPHPRPLSPEAGARGGAAASAAAGGRAGTTLVEVLMSLLVMGIGVVAVATLFPASVLRSVQATQLTNATILRFNAETAISVMPQLVHNPTGRNDPEFFNGSNYLIDPWGANEPGSSFGSLNRYDFGLTTVQSARDFVCLPDSWVNVVTTSISPLPAGETSVELPTGVDISQVGTSASGTPSRVILFDSTGRRSETRDITSIVGRTINWSRETEIEVERVRVEQFEPRYSYLLTVRKLGTSGDPPVERADIDVVVFFRRSFESEFAVPRNNQDVVEYRGTRTFRVTLADPIPSFKRGGYFLDVDEAKWHRIQKLSQISERSWEIVVEGDTSRVPGPVNIVFPRGVIDVYPLGEKLP